MFISVYACQLNALMWIWMLQIWIIISPQKSLKAHLQMIHQTMLEVKPNSEQWAGFPGDGQMEDSAGREYHILCCLPQQSGVNGHMRGPLMSVSCWWSKWWLTTVKEIWPGISDPWERVWECGGKLKCGTSVGTEQCCDAVVCEELRDTVQRCGLLPFLEPKL